MQLATTSPSSQTVHAEQAPRSQPIFVPVSPSSSRSTSTSVVAASTCTVQRRPLTVSDSSIIGDSRESGCPDDTPLSRQSFPGVGKVLRGGASCRRGGGAGERLRAAEVIALYEIDAHALRGFE